LGAPRTLNVSDDARPIWSAKQTARPNDSSATTTMGSAGYLRVVESGEGTRAGSTASATMPLKWRGRQRDGAVQRTDAGSTRPSGFWSGSDVPLSGPVRPAAHQAEADPFKNPFGDKLAAADDTPLPPATEPKRTGQAPDAKLLAPVPEMPKGQPATPARPSTEVRRSPTADPANEVPPASKSGTAATAADQRTFQPAAPSDTASSPAELAAPAALDTQQDAVSKPARMGLPSPGLSEPNRPAPALELPRSSAPQLPQLKLEQPPEDDSATPPPLPGSGQRAKPALPTAEPVRPSIQFSPRLPADSAGPADDRAAKKCERTYNDRNCCEEESKCNEVRRKVRNDSIKKISLDITASFKPDAETDEERREASQNQLREIPSRQWHNRAGKAVAEGRIVQVQHQRLVIRGEEGQPAVVPIRELCDDDLCFLAAWWGIPTECTLGDDTYVPRSWEPTTFTWKASALCHKPLYFEERILERYGHTAGPFVQPALSGAHFFLNVAVLPYKMGLNPPLECQYPLGYYRPGSCAPRLLPALPISLRGGLAEAGVVTGLFFLIP
jgi:hypothetical protein